MPSVCVVSVGVCFAYFITFTRIHTHAESASGSSDSDEDFDGVAEADVSLDSLLLDDMC